MLSILETHPAAKSALIALNNQAVIQALQNNRSQPAQHLLDYVHVFIWQLKCKCRNLHIHLEWVPGHMDIKGNELADEHAKRAATGDISHTEDLPDLLKKCLPVSIAALKANWKKSIPQRWRKAWLNLPRHAKISQIDSRMPNRQIYRTLSSLPRRATSILIELRTGHVSLNAFLKKIKASDSALCKKCRQPETVVHYFKYCK